MSQPHGPQSGYPQSGYQRAPLTADEQARAELNFVPYVAENLAAHGRFRVTADTPELVALFQRVTRRVGDQLGRRVVSVADGRDIVITFGHEDSALGVIDAELPE